MSKSEEELKKFKKELDELGICQINFEDGDYIYLKGFTQDDKQIGIRLGTSENPKDLQVKTLKTTTFKNYEDFAQQISAAGIQLTENSITQIKQISESRKATQQKSQSIMQPAAPTSKSTTTEPCFTVEELKELQNLWATTEGKIQEEQRKKEQHPSPPSISTTPTIASQTLQPPKPARDEERDGHWLGGYNLLDHINKTGPEYARPKKPIIKPSSPTEVPATIFPKQTSALQPTQSLTNEAPVKVEQNASQNTSNPPTTKTSSTVQVPAVQFQPTRISDTKLQQSAREAVKDVKKDVKPMPEKKEKQSLKERFLGKFGKKQDKGDHQR